MRGVRSLWATVLMAGVFAVPVSASAVGDATYSLASYRAMAAAQASPSERLLAVYHASVERAAMVERLRDRFPTLLW